MSNTFKPGVLLLVTVVSLSSTSGFAQDRGNTQITLDGKTVSVNYGRPTLQGRDPNQLISVGHVWRLGMNQATTLTTGAALKFGSLDVPAASYSLFAKKTGATAWDLILNKQTGQWGTQRDPSKDLGSVPLTIGDGAQSVEHFTIELATERDNEGKLSMKWGTLVVSTEFTTN